MVDKDIVQFSTSVEEYNLEPTWENYASLTEERNGFEPICSVDNFDIMSLLYIKENGYPEDGLVCEYPYDFSYENEFQDLSWSFSKLDSDEAFPQHPATGTGGENKKIGEYESRNSGNQK